MHARAPLVLIVSSPQDIHATTVADHLRRLGARPVLFDLSHYPTTATVSTRFGAADDVRITIDSHAPIHARDLTAVWWRRPQRPRIAAEVGTPQHRRFADNEAALFLNGLWQVLDCRWVNPVRADSAAAFKPYQLHVAREVGLTVPDTVITNDPAAAAEFIEEHGGDVVYKALGGVPPDAWRETRKLGAAELRLLPLVRHAPVIFQECLNGADLRVTVVGDHIFAGEMETSRSRYPYDVRMDMTVPVRAVTLDESTAGAVHALMRRLGLVYGAIDLKRDRDGRLHFLEINPAGQFLFIEELADLPISQALARYLATGV